MNPPRGRRPPPEPDDLRQARGVLRETLAQLSVALTRRFPTPPNALKQPETDFFRLYAAARQREPSFRERVEAFAARHGVRGQTRPSGVKRLERIVEKYSTGLAFPLDLLGGKFVVTNLWDLYETADRVGLAFTVVGYADRTVVAQGSGYRDLQFVVDLEGHYAELKVVHEFFDELDAHEHRLYEIRRELDAKVKNKSLPLSESDGSIGAAVLTPIERLVLDKLKGTSRELFDATWALVQDREREP